MPSDAPPLTDPRSPPPLPPVLAATAARLSGAEPGGSHAAVAIIGLGYVGLPLAMELCAAGADVVGVDVDEARCDALNAGHSHVGDVSDDTLVTAISGSPGRFRATPEPSAIGDADAVIICVPTPLRKSKDPDISYVVRAAESVAAHARPGQLVVLESTTYPGTTDEILVPLLRGRGLTPGVDVAVAFSPERVDPGNRRYGIRNTPKVVGGVTPACTAVATTLYSRCCDTVVPVSSPAAAEAAKLLENVFRSVNIGLVNEFALICKELGLDVWEVIDAAATKPFGFMRFVPGPGLGGHCIPVDPHYLSWKLRSHGFTARFIELADAINSRMPAHVVSVVTDALNDHSKPVRGTSILLMGLAYKPDVSDVRESPALVVFDQLLARGADVAYHDPFVPAVTLGGVTHRSRPLTDDALARADCVVLLTDHSAFDMQRVLTHGRLIVDTRNATRDARAAHPDLAARVHLI